MAREDKRVIQTSNIFQIVLKGVGGILLPFNKILECQIGYEIELPRKINRLIYCSESGDINHLKSHPASESTTKT